MAARKTRIYKHKVSGRLYEVEGLFHSKTADGRDVCVCKLLSAYDGMPTGPTVYIPVDMLE